MNRAPDPAKTALHPEVGLNKGHCIEYSVNMMMAQRQIVSSVTAIQPCIESSWRIDGVASSGFGMREQRSGCLRMFGHPGGDGISGPASTTGNGFCFRYTADSGSRPLDGCDVRILRAQLDRT